jgi:hypothetical protein
MPWSRSPWRNQHDRLTIDARRLQLAVAGGSFPEDQGQELQAGMACCASVFGSVDLSCTLPTDDPSGAKSVFDVLRVGAEILSDPLRWLRTASPAFGHIFGVCSGYHRAGGSADWSRGLRGGGPGERGQAVRETAAACDTVLRSWAAAVAPSDVPRLPWLRPLARPCSGTPASIKNPALSLI